MLLRTALGTIALVLVSAVSAGAQLTGSTVTLIAGNGLPDPCRDALVTRTVGSGPGLVLADWMGGCAGAYSANVFASGLSLVASEWGNYTLGTLHLSFVGAPTISDVFFLGFTGNFLYPDYSRNQSNLTPTVTFDGTDIDITFDPGGEDEFAFNEAGLGTAEFSITAESLVTPEPATLTLLATGLVGLFFVARLRRKLQTTIEM